MLSLGHLFHSWWGPQSLGDLQGKESLMQERHPHYFHRTRLGAVIFLWLLELADHNVGVLGESHQCL